MTRDSRSPVLRHHPRCAVSVASSLAMSSDMFDANTTVNGEDTSCQLFTPILSCTSINVIMPYYMNCLFLFTAGSNSTALPDISIGGSVLVLVLLGGMSFVVLMLMGVGLGFSHLKRSRGKFHSRRGWCTCMSCTHNCRSYYFVMWAYRIHALASLVMHLSMVCPTSPSWGQWWG